MRSQFTPKPCPICGKSFFKPKHPSQSYCSKRCARLGETRSKRSAEERFWSHVQKTDTCWLWTGHVVRRYGQFHDDAYQPVRAHRFSYELHYGGFPSELFVLHRCDVPLCVRPDHLFLGTNQDNKNDEVAKGRHAFGERDGLSKLTEENVREIRRLLANGEQQRTVAMKFGISSSTVWSIFHRETWKHVA